MAAVGGNLAVEEQAARSPALLWGVFYRAECC